jgi:iron complex outermembrane receptor protein
MSKPNPRQKSVKTGLMLSTALILCAFPGMAVAQTAAAPEEQAQPEADRGGPTVIIVTSRKREETLQDIPATIGVVGEEQLENAGVSNLQQLSTVAPGVNIGKAPTGNELGITVRGLGSAPGVPSFDSSVSLFVDGVYAPRSLEFTASMFDIERIEVIRGTQAALLGKNTSLGAISLVTRKPGNTFAGNIRTSYEMEQGSALVTGGVDVPMGDTFGVRLSGQLGEDVGSTISRIDGKNSPRNEDAAIRAVAVWTPTDALELTTLLQHNEIKNFGSAAEFISSTGLPQQLAALAGYPGTIETNLDRRGAAYSPNNGGEQWGKLKTDKAALTADLSLGDYTLTSITAYSAYTNENLSDADFMPGDYLNRGVDEDGNQFSQEVRLVSPADGSFDYIVGALYIDGALNNVTTTTANYPFGPAPGVNITGTPRTTFEQTNEALSAFAQGNYRFTDRFSISSGLRWTKEDKSVDMARVAVVPGFFASVIYPPYAPFSLSRSEEAVDYSFGAQYWLTDAALVYASWGKGTKGGGYAQSVTLLQNAEYDKETAKTAEVGLKLQDTGGRWVLNTALFDTQVDDFQLVTFNGLEFVVGNTDLSSRGVEVEARWSPLDSLNLFLNTTYVDAEDRRTGNQIPLAPEWSGVAGFTYRTPVTSFLDFKADGSVDHRGERYYQQNPAAVPPSEAFTTLNLGFAAAAPDDAWELRLIGRNLTDENASAFAFPTPILPAGNRNAISERGRTVTLQLSAQF